MARDATAIEPASGGSVAIAASARHDGKPGFVLVVRSYSGDAGTVHLTLAELRKLAGVMATQAGEQ